VLSPDAVFAENVA